MSTHQQERPPEGQAAAGGAAGIWRGRRVVVSMGAGGVGKTTVSAALALAAAAAGQRTLVMTVDPARRLAQALGVSDPGSGRLRLDPAPFAAQGLQLRAPVDIVMPDVGATFNEVIGRYANSEAARDVILANRIYRHLCQSMSGAHEYAAVEALFEVCRENAWDTIVLDTPPSQNALDFLEAPDKVTGFFDSAAVPWLMRPAKLAGRVTKRLWDVGSQWIYAGLAKVAGGETLTDIGDFLFSLDGMYAGLSERARAVHDLLRSPEVAYVVVTAPGPGPQAAATQLIEQLGAQHIPIQALVVNRLHPMVWPPARAEAGAQQVDQAMAPLGEAAVHSVRQALAAAQEQACLEAAAIAELRRQVPGVPVTTLEELPPGVEGPGALAALAPHFAPSPEGRRHA